MFFIFGCGFTKRIISVLLIITVAGIASACTTGSTSPPKGTETTSTKVVDAGAVGRHEEALRNAEDAIRLKPDNATAWTNKGAALLNLGRLEESAKASEEAVRLNPTIALAWYNLSGALGRLGRNEEALKAADEAIRLQPLNAWNWVNKAGSLLALGRYKEALAASDEVIRLQPENAVGWNHKGLSLTRLGRGEEAKSWLCRALGVREQLGDNGANAEQSLTALGVRTDKCSSIPPPATR